MTDFSWGNLITLGFSDGTWGYIWWLDFYEGPNLTNWSSQQLISFLSFISYLSHSVPRLYKSCPLREHSDDNPKEIYPLRHESTLSC